MLNGFCIEMKVLQNLVAQIWIMDVKWLYEYVISNIVFS